MFALPHLDFLKVSQMVDCHQNNAPPPFLIHPATSIHSVRDSQVCPAPDIHTLVSTLLLPYLAKNATFHLHNRNQPAFRRGCSLFSNPIVRLFWQILFTEESEKWAKGATMAC